MTEGLKDLAAYVAQNDAAARFDIQLGDSSIPFLVVPNTKKIESLKKTIDEYRAVPERIKGSAKIVTIDSLIDHANKFKGETSALFANDEDCAITASYDYHGAGKPSFCTHEAVFKAQLSTQWQAWSTMNGERMNQTNFAEFIENNALDLIDAPAAESMDAGDIMVLNIAKTLGFTIGTPADIVKLARGIAINESAKAKSIVNTSTGETQIQYESEHSDAGGQRLAVPNLFLIGAPVFEGDAFYKIVVRLRYRLQGGQVSWFYEIYRAERLLDHAFTEICKIAQSKTSLPLYMGTPEYK